VELTHQAQRGLAGELTAASRGDDDEMAADQDATRFIMVTPESNPRRGRPTDQARPAPAAANHDDDLEDDDGRTRFQAPPERAKAAPPGKALPVWLVMVGAAILLFRALLALYLRSRSTPVAAAPIEAVIPVASTPPVTAVSSLTRTDSDDEVRWIPAS
jgi:hypothetical protein